MAKFTAVIDFGSNSIRLVIFQRTSRFGFKVVYETKRRVRVGEGAYLQNGLLQDFAMERAITALEGFLSVIRAFKVRKILAIATSAVRDAPNKNIFINKIKRRLKLNLKVIDGKTEALLGGIACANLLKLDKKAISVDIGGGSTEFTIIENGRVLETQSINLGTVRLKELFFDNQDNFEQQLEKAKNYIKSEFSKLDKNLFSGEILVGIGGTIRALSKVIQKISNYPLQELHGYEYSYSENSNLIREIINVPPHRKKEFLFNLGFKFERIDVIQFGVLIFDEVINFFNIDKIITSSVGIREGVFLKDNLRNVRYRYPSNFNPSLRNILDEFSGRDLRSQKIFLKTVEELFNIFLDLKITPNNNILENSSVDNSSEINSENSFADEVKISDLLKSEDFDFYNILRTSAKLSDIGVKIDFYGNTNNGFQMILNRYNYKVSHREKILVAMLVRFSNKAEIDFELFEMYKTLLPSLTVFKTLHSIIYLAKLLNSDFSFEKKFEIIFKDEKTFEIIFFSRPLFDIFQENFKGLQIDINLIPTLNL